MARTPGIITLSLTDTGPWLRTMRAAVDLLAAVEEADAALIPDDVVEKARALRETFERRTV